jgi:hypothetical protein
MEKYGTDGLLRQQRDELHEVRARLGLLRGFLLPFRKEASAEIRQLEERARALEKVLAASSDGPRAQE